MTTVIRVAKSDAIETMVAELHRIFGEEVEIIRVDTFIEALERVMADYKPGNKIVIETAFSFAELALVYHHGVQADIILIRPVGEVNITPDQFGFGAAKVFSHYEKFTGLEVKTERLGEG